MNKLYLTPHSLGVCLGCQCSVGVCLGCQCSVGVCLGCQCSVGVCLGCQCSVVSVFSRGMPWVSVFSRGMPTAALSILHDCTWYHLVLAGVPSALRRCYAQVQTTIIMATVSMDR